MNNNFLKYLTIIFFFCFIFIFPIITLSTPDKKISEIENKVLTPFPRLNSKTIKDKSFMANFDKYSSDHFPYREQFVEIKNSYSYLIGKREFREIYINNNNRYLEKFILNDTIIDKNISQVTKLSNFLYDDYNIKSTLMIIPTSIAFYKDSLAPWAISDNQELTLNYINSKTNNSSYLNFYSPYDVFKKFSNLPIYFNTDHHWTQLGARIAYEDMYNNNIDMNLIYEGYKEVSDSFYGTYFSKALLPFIDKDKVNAYMQFKDFKISIDLTKEFDSLYDKNRLNTKNKYQYFLHGDPALAVIEGNKNKKNEILIFKDSFAHSFIPFLTSNYKKIHVIDPRYYHVDFKKYLNENPYINEVLFMSNIQTFNSSEIYNFIR